MLGTVFPSGKEIPKCLELFFHQERRSQNTWSYFSIRKIDPKMLGAVFALGRSSKNSLKANLHKKKANSNFMGAVPTRCERVKIPLEPGYSRKIRFKLPIKQTVKINM
ncbi:hypothetical protein DLK05_06195 [Ancylomarina longa]|uniref:Uncharacterized protein n=1 Tax=Ancylomarina longa TaxID=2487017 RepID=A0A434AWF6_9BACT|nr:hypothetical protein DLK05_06195 [Ancylomarina longa]